MNATAPDDQTLLRDTAQRFVREQYGPRDRQASIDSPGGCRPSVWHQFAALGWLGLPFPARHGGFDGSPNDMLQLMQVFGCGLVVEPYLSSVILSGGVILNGGSDVQKEQLLPSLIRGTVRLAAGFHEEAGGYSTAHVATTARSTPDGYALDGHKCVVLGATGADALIVSARTGGNTRDGDGISLFLLDAQTAGVTLRPYVLIDGRHAADVVLRDVHIPAGAMVGPKGKGRALIDQAIDEATLACVGEAVGVLERALDMTIDYLKTRQQFGKPLSTFQVLRHRVVDIHVALEELRSLALSAAAERDPRRRAKAISAAKVHIGETGTRAMLDTIQLHGAIGMTEDYALGHYVRRFTTIDRLFGGAPEHLERFRRHPADGEIGHRT